MYMRKEFVEIQGIPEYPEEFTNHIVKEVGRAMDGEIIDNDICISHCLPLHRDPLRARNPAHHLS